jgi:DNA-binding response OmpR family regulator
MRWIRIVSVASLALFLGVLLCIPGAGAVSAPDYEKILQIHLHPEGSGYQVTSTEVRYGKAPHQDVKSGVLGAAILDSGNRELVSFPLRDPSVVQADSMGSPDGDNFVGYTETVVPDELTVTVPYQQGMSAFRLTDSRSGTVLASADLAGPITQFCTDYFADPDCLARAVPPKAAAPDTATTVVLATLFSASVIVAAGLAILTIRKRTGTPVIPAISENAREKQTVLIVDDDPDIVDVIRQILDDKGYLSLSADSGRSCLALIKEKVPDLILLDVGMAPMDGWQTLEQIKKDPATKTIPVLMLTGHKLTAVTARQYKICIDDYITKPFHPDDLGAAIDSILERKQKLKESLVLVKKAGVDMDMFCEFATLTRRISVNKRIVDILQAPQAVPSMVDMRTLDEMSVADYISVTTKDQEKRAEQLRQQINSSFRSKGLPELNW